VSGTVPGKVGAYAATGGGLAVIGAGSAVSAFDEHTGIRLWRVPLTGVPAGSVIVGVRAFPAIIAVGVAPPQRQLSQGKSGQGKSRQGKSGQGKSGHGQSTRGGSRHGLAGAGRYEVMLSAATGRQIRIYPAATYGGAVAANDATTVIVGAHAIIAYDNATGRSRWSRAIGPTGQTWRVTGGTIYVTDGGSMAGGTGSTALRRIDLRTGAQHILRLKPRGSCVSSATIPGSLGSLSDAAGNVVLFSGADGVQAFDGTNGQGLWCRALADVELADSGQSTVYLASGNRLLGLDILTGRGISTAPISVAASLYWVTSDVALGLDENGLGEAWGYDLKTRRIVWTSGSLPWPHFFVDLSGLGGSLSPGSAIVLLATCENVGNAATANSAPVCRRPELEAVRV
jgi:outer membrane protein assembly factor BamB